MIELGDPVLAEVIKIMFKSDEKIEEEERVRGDIVTHIDDFQFPLCLTVTYKYCAGHKATRDTPEEPEGIEISSVNWRNLEILDRLSDHEIEQIEAEILREDQSD